MLDFLRKKLVENITVDNRDFNVLRQKRVLINGREIALEGYQPYAATTILIWEVPVQSSKQFKYVVSIGVAQQNFAYPCANEEDICDMSVEKAYIDPCFKFVFDDLNFNIEDLLFPICRRILKMANIDKMLLTEEEVNEYILKNYNDTYSQKYPLDFIYFNIVKPFN